MRKRFLLLHSKQGLMRKVERKLNLVTLMLIFSMGYVQSQPVQVEGIVFDKRTQQRLSGVIIQPLTSKKLIYSNLHGEFYIEAAVGDKLMASAKNYFPDTLVVGSNKIVLFFLQKKAIQLREVLIKDHARKSPKATLEASQKEYPELYDRVDDEDGYVVSPNGGAGLSIDALYETWSGKALQKAKLRARILEDYQQQVINQRYNLDFLAFITGLSGAELLEFSTEYRPTYNFIRRINDYDLILFVKLSLAQYRLRKRPEIN